MKIKQIKTIVQTPHVNLLEAEYIDRFGAVKHWVFSSRQSEPKCMTGNYHVPDAVIIVPFHIELQKLVIIQEYRVPLSDYQYGFPAGIVDEGESVEAAVARELLEETGLCTETILKISPPLYSSSGLTDEAVSMAYVECSGSPSDHLNEGSEDIETIFVTPADAKALCLDSNAKFDVKTWLVLHHFACTNSSVKGMIGI